MRYVQSCYGNKGPLCPYCAGETDGAEFIDVGVGGAGVQCTPWVCQDCCAVEVGPHQDGDEEENRCGFFRPLREAQP